MRSETTKLNLPKIITDSVSFKEIELDSPLLEFNPDISRLIRVDAFPSVESIDINGNTCEVKGKITFGMLYETDYKSKLAHTNVTTDLVQRFDLPDGDYAEIFPSANIKCMFLTCKLLGPRRFILKARTQTKLKAVAMLDIPVVDTNSTDINTYFKTCDIETVKPYKSSVDIFKFSETLPVDKPIGSVVTTYTNLGIPEVQLADGTTNIRTVLLLKILYEVEDTDNEYIFVTAAYPVNISIETPDVHDDDYAKANVELESLIVVPDLDEYGENKVLNIDYTLKTSVIYYEEAIEVVACDGFSGRNEYNCEYSGVKFDVTLPSNDKTFIYEKSYNTDKAVVSEIMDTTVNFTVNDKILADNILNVKGMATFDVLARTDDGIVNMTFSSDFDESMPFENDNAKISDIEIYPFEVSSNLYGGETIAVRALAYVKPEAYETVEKSFISNFEVGEPKPGSDKGICFYYPDNQEDIWAIAKKYSQNPKKLRDDNREAFDEYGKIKKSMKYLAIKK